MESGGVSLLLVATELLVVTWSAMSIIENCVARFFSSVSGFSVSVTKMMRYQFLEIVWEHFESSRK